MIALRIAVHTSWLWVEIEHAGPAPDLTLCLICNDLEGKSGFAQRNWNNTVRKIVRFC